MILGHGGDAIGQLRAHLGRDRMADRRVVEPAHQVVLVKRTVAAQINLVDAAGQSGQRLLDHPAVARAGRHVAVAELVGKDHILLGPQRHNRLITTMAVISALGRALITMDHRGVDIDRRGLDRAPARQIEDQLGAGRGQAQQRG